MPLHADVDFPTALAEASATKAKVELTLKSGTKIGGKVASVGAHHVLITEVTGREFFDSLVALSEVAALEMRR